MTVWWAEHAWLGGSRTAERVTLSEKGGRFDAVTPDTEPPPGAHCLRGLLLPGLANAHSHAFHRALRGRTHEHTGTFWTWRRLMYDVADRLDPDSYGRLARAVYAEMALAGFTAVGEFHYLHHGPGGVPYADPNQMGRALLDAAADAGIRITLLDTAYADSGEDVQRRFADRDWAARVSELDADNDRTRIGAAIHSVRAVSPQKAAEVAAVARGRDWPLHAHVSEQRGEHDEWVTNHGATPLAVLSAAGALSGRFTAVHGTHFTAHDTAMLAEAGGGCCACPTTERDLGDGIGPFDALWAAGVRLSIGTDSHAVVDAWEETRAVELHARLRAEARGLIPPAALLHAASSGGMDSLGWEQSGRLEPGRLADFVVVALDSPRTAGADLSLAATAVFAASAADVTTVVVGGRTVVEGGRHTLIEDVPGELAAAVTAVLS